MPVYSIIIPAYNESERITATLESVAAYARQQQWDVEVLVVDDGSRDTQLPSSNSWPARIRSSE